MPAYQWKWLVGRWSSFIWMSSILLPPTIDLHTSAVVCCDQLPQMKVTRLLHLLQWSVSCASLSLRVMGCLCQQIYLLKIQASLSCDTCSAATEMWLCHGREVSVIEWPPSYIGGKEWGVWTKSGNRLEYIKWGGVSIGLEPILDSFFFSFLKLSCRFRSGECVPMSAVVGF